MTVERIANHRTETWSQLKNETEAPVIRLGRAERRVPDNDDDPGPDSPGAAAVPLSFAASAGGAPLIPRVFPGL
jgi:hypothetical protein